MIEWMNEVSKIRALEAGACKVWCVLIYVGLLLDLPVIRVSFFCSFLYPLFLWLPFDGGSYMLSRQQGDPQK